MIQKGARRLLVILGLLATCLPLCTCLLAADQPYTFSFSDDFSKYRDGGDGSPTWETDSYLGWEVSGGAFMPLDHETSFALPKKAPHGRLATVEATVTLRGTRSASWKIAGIVIYQDSGNYWHLALVESPDPSGRSHHVELSEAYNGKWLAHAEKSTLLTSVSSAGQNFDWKYDHPYRLSIKLDPKGIVGTVCELDGTERARIGYKFDNKAVTWGRPGLDSAGFRAEFDDFSAKVGMEVSAEELRKTAAFPPYSGKGWAGTKGKRTGFFHAERIDDRWWAIDPAGRAFYIIGTDHVNYNVHSCEKLGYAPYHRNCERIYGAEQKWADTTVARLRRWGFNSLGANSSPSTRRKGLPHMEFLGMGASFSGMDYITEKTTWTGFPNVFSPDFEKFCDRLARRHCAPLKGDPWVTGYFIDNELEWFGKSGSLFSDAFKRPADHSARIALVDLLRTRYENDVKAFNAAWKTDIARFDDLLELTQAPKPATPKAESDVREYARLAAERYFAITASAIRRHDPNHMVLGCRFAGAAPDVWDIAGKYCDIVSVNSYRRVDLEKGALADGYENDLAEWYRKTKRPLMITEWSFPALDTPLPSEHGAGQRVPTQKDRARAFTIFQKLLFATPFVVGSDFFMWVDEPALGISSTFPEDSNYGLVNENDEPYKLLTEAARNLHRLVYDIHSGNAPDVYAKPAEERGTFIVGNSGKSDASCTVSLWIDGKLAEHKLEIPGGESRRIEVPQDSISAPGGHFLVCRVDQAMALAEPNEADNLATQHFYTPGLPAWEAASQYSRIPIIVTNPTDKAVRSVPMSLKLCELALIDWSRAKDALGVVRAQDGRQSEIPFQVVADDELLFALDELGPRECATVFVYLNSAARLKTQARVTYRETGDGFEVDNGALKLVKLESEGGYAFDRISLGAVEVGSFAPVIWQQVGQDFWVRPSRVEAVEAHEGPVALVLDMIFLFDGGRAAAITEVGPEGKYAAIETRPHRYRTKYRFTIHPDKPYFDSRFLWVENTDEEPWHFHTYYHYIPSNIAGDSSDDKPKAKYWLDAAAKLCYGVEAPDGFSVILWKDSAGLEHPDVYRCPYFSRTLKPGERLAAADPPVHTIAGSEDEFARAADELHALSDLHIQVCEIESADIPAQRHYDRAGMKVARFPGNPIIRPNMDGRMGNNVNGPSLIRVPGWVKNPLGRYYLYFAHHKGEYIRLAYADQLEGPWTTYEPGTLRLEDSFCGHHIASPDVHVDNEKREVRMYYHGPTTGGQKSRVAISKDGIHFTARPEILGAPYLRVFRWGGFYYALGMPGIFYRSKDGLSNFEQGPTLLTENMRHSAFKLDGNRLSVFYSDIGDCPERILLSTIELTPDWMTWKASEPVIVLEPEMDYEGADLPLKPSRSGWAPESVRQLRDPAVFREEGRTYLLYSVAGEQGIAIAELKEQA